MDGTGAWPDVFTRCGARIGIATCRFWFSQGRRNGVAPGGPRRRPAPHSLYKMGAMSNAPPEMTFVEYDATYRKVFVRLTQTVHSVLPSADVEHVGSTSVPGLGGRGAIDAVLLSEPPDHAVILTALLQVAFTEFPYGPAKPALTTTLQLEGRDYVVLVYLLPRTHELVRGWLAFREYMLQHPEEVERYAAIKRAAIAEGKTQPWTYQQAKTPYLVELAQRIASSSDSE